MRTAGVQAAAAPASPSREGRDRRRQGRHPDVRASDTVTGLTPAPPCPRAARVRAARVQDTRVRVLTCDAHTLCTSRTPRGPRPDAPAPPSAPKVELPTGGGGSLRCCVGDTGALPGPRVVTGALATRVPCAGHSPLHPEAAGRGPAREELAGAYRGGRREEGWPHRLL